MRHRRLKWNESGFRPPLCTYRLNWDRRTSWGWWDDWDDTVLQTQDSKFKPWRSEAEHTTSRSRRLPTILTFTRGWGRNIFCFFNRRDREPNPNSGVKGSGANHRRLKGWASTDVTSCVWWEDIYHHLYFTNNISARWNQRVLSASTLVQQWSCIYSIWFRFNSTTPPLQMWKCFASNFLW